MTLSTDKKRSEPLRVDDRAPEKRGRREAKTPLNKVNIEGVLLTPRQQQMAIGSAERQKTISRARQLANSGRFSDWRSVEDSMKSGNQLRADCNLFEDYEVRRKIDAGCDAARREMETAKSS